MPRHTEEERQKNTVATRIGQSNTGKVNNIQSDKVTEQPLVKVGGTRSARITKPAIPVSLALPSAPGGISTSRREGTQAIQALRTRKRQVETFTDLKPTRIDLAAEEAPLGIAKRGPVPFKFKPKEAVVKGGVRRGAAIPKKSFNILNFEGIENVFSRAGDLATFFASPEFQKGQRKARGAALGAKGRRADLKLQNERIKALSGVLKNTADPEQRSLIQEQISKMIETTSAVGGVRRGLDISTVEGFAATLKDLDIFSDDEIRSFANRKFAGGG